MELDIERLVAGGETYTVEFKSEANDDELAEAAVCLANGDGGQILIGVTDDGALVGAQPRHGGTTEPRRLEALIANKTSPALSVAVAVERLDGLDVVIVNVPKAGSLVATTAGRYVRRATKVDGKPQCLPMLPHEALARKTLLGGGDLSASPLVELSVADLDPAEFDRFRRLAGGGGDEHLSELSDLDCLSLQSGSQDVVCHAIERALTDAGEALQLPEDVVGDIESDAHGGKVTGRHLHCSVRRAAVRSLLGGLTSGSVPPPASGEQCRPEVGGPTRPRDFSLSARHGFAALSRSGAGVNTGVPCSFPQPRVA